MLAFEVSAGKIDAIEARYRAKHPGLLVRQDVPSIVEYPSDGFRILDVYAYVEVIPVGLSITIFFFIIVTDDFAILRCMCT